MANVGNAHINITAGSQQAEKELTGFEGRIRRSSRLVKRVTDGMTGFRTTARDIKNMSQETQNMYNEMRVAQQKTRGNMMQFREQQIKVQYGYHKLAESAKEYQGTNAEFMDEIGKLGAQDKKIKDEMMKNNEHMKQSFFQSVGAMMARSSQASKIGDNFKKMGGIMNNANRPLLAIADKMDRIARAGTPAALALKQLGPTANMKDLNDRMMMITQGIMRFQGVALAAGIAAGIFYGALHKGAKKASAEYAGAWKGMVDSLKKVFEPLVEVFADLMTPVYKAIKFVADLVVEFQKANPVLTKLIAAFVVFVPLLTLILSPLAVGIGMWAGLQAAMAAMSPILAPLITGFASILGTVVLVSAGIVALGAAFIYLYKKSDDFRAFVNVLRDGIKVAFSAIYDYVDKAIKRIKEIASAIAEWEGFIPVLAGLVTAFSAYYTILGLVWARKKLILAVTKAYQAVVKLGIALQGGYTAAMIAFNAAGGGMKGVLAVLRAGMLKLNLAMVANPIGLVIALLAGLVVGLVIAYKRSETFRKIVDKAWLGIKKTAKSVFEWFTVELPKLAKRFYDWANKVYADTVGAMRKMRDNVIKFFIDLKNGADKAFTDMTQAIRSARDAVIKWVLDMVAKADKAYAGLIQSIRNVRDAVVKWFKEMVNQANQLFEKTNVAIRRVRDAIVNGFKKAWEIAKDVAFKATKFIVQLLVDVVKTYVYIFKNWRPLLKKGIDALWNVVKKGFKAIAGFISQTWSSIVNGSKSLGKRFVSAMRSGWSSFINTFKKWMKSLKDSVVNAFVTIVKFYRELPGRMKKAMAATWKTFSSWIALKYKKFIEDTRKIISFVVKYFRDLAGRMKSALSSTWSKFTNWIAQKYKKFREDTSKLINFIIKYFKDLPGRMRTAIASTWSKFLRWYVSKILDMRKKMIDFGKYIVKLFKDLSGRIATAFRSTWKKVKDVFNAITKYIRDKVSSTFKTVVDWAKKLPGRIGSAIRSAAKATYNAVASLASGMMKRMNDTFAKIVKGAKALPGKIGTGIKNMKDKALNGVISMTNSLLGGMGKAVNGLVSGINGILSKLEIKDRIPKWKVPKYAQGTEGHPGGPAILGDGGGRELFRTPDGTTALSPATDTLYNLPKGTTVLSAEKTRKFLGKVPRYAKGVGDFFSDSMDWAKAKYNGAKSKATDVKDFFKKQVKDIMDFASNPSKLVNMMVEKLGLKMPSGKGIGKIAGGGMNFLIKEARNFIKSKFDMFMGDGSGGVNVFKGLTKTQGFGKAGGGNGYFHHDGVDYAGPIGSFIKSVTGGKVSFAGMTTGGYGGGFGNLVKVKQGIYEHFYGHLQKVIAQSGQPVTAGQTLLGTLGSTGNSTGPHVHYEVRKNGTPVDPMPFLTGKKLGGNLSSWIRKAMSLAGVKGDNWMSGLMTIAKHESGGNPNAVNDWDSNARAGIPSKGLMQTIGPTFSAYMKKGYGNIMNPVDNTIAAINYIKSRYGSISNVPGVIARRLGQPYVGYETGGFIHKQQTILAGEGNKREVVVPLQNKRYMQPFADAVAAGMGGQNGGVVFEQVNNIHTAKMTPGQVALEIKKQSQRAAREWNI